MLYEVDGEHQQQQIMFANDEMKFDIKLLKKKKLYGWGCNGIMKI